VVSVAVTGEPSRDTAVATGTQLEEAATTAEKTTSKVLVPCAPSQGRGQARPESRPAGDHEAAGDAADDDAPPGGANWEANPRHPPGTRKRCW
jgi:hypothetical protein